MLSGLFSRFIKTSVSSFDKLLKEQLDVLEESSVRPAFSNSESKFYLRAVELNEFHSFSVMITGCLNINTVDGCTLIFYGDGKELIRKSDSEVVKGDYSQTLNVGITSFDIDMDDELVEFLKSGDVTGVRLETRNGKLRKENFVLDFPTVYQADLIDATEVKDPGEDEVIVEEVLAETEDSFGEEE